MVSIISEKSVFLKYFILLCLSVFLVLFASRLLLISDDVYFEAFGEQLSFERINELIELNNKWDWVIYPVIPPLYLLKFLFIVLCLATGAFASRVEVTFRALFKIVLMGEFIFLLPPVIKLFWFTLINTNYTLNDLQQFSPLSALSLFDPNDLQPWLIYPLGLFNLFEVAYIATISYLLSKELKSEFAQSLKLVISSYGIGLVVWVVFVMFITVSLTA